MPALERTLSVTQGDDLHFTVHLRGTNGLPADLTGYQARLRVLPRNTSVTPLLDLQTSTHSTQIIPFVGGVKVRINNLQTAALLAGAYPFELFVRSPDNLRTRVMFGLLKVIGSPSTGIWS